MIADLPEGDEAGLGYAPVTLTASRRDHWSSVGVIALALTLGLGLRITALPSIRTPRPDDAFSYLAATCHLRENGRLLWTKSAPFGRWEPAAAWQRLSSVEERFCFRAIGRDLARDDIHPPLYFWLLHLWIVAFGVSARAGPALNIVLFAITAVLLYRLARRAAAHRVAAALGVLLWSVGPSVLEVTLLSRPYELLALMTVALCWLLLLLSEPERAPARRDHVPLALTAAAGMLTHYHFALAAAAGVAVACLRLRGTGRRRRLGLLGALVAGLLISLALHPPAGLEAWRNLPESPFPFSWTGAGNRARRTLETLGVFGGFGATRLVWIGASVWAVVSLVRLARRPPGEPRARRESEGLLALTALSALLLGEIVVLYVTFVTPHHAMGARYLSMVWPLAAVVVGAALWRSRLGRLLAVALGAALLLAGVDWRREKRAAAPGTVLIAPSTGPVLADGADIHLYRALWHVAPDVPVYAADVDRLRSDPDGWLSGLGDRATYVNLPGRRSLEARELVLSTVRDRYVVVEKVLRRYDVATFELARRPQPP
jgi:hypothetical protein